MSFSAQSIQSIHVVVKQDVEVERQTGRQAASRHREMERDQCRLASCIARGDKFSMLETVSF